MSIFKRIPSLLVMPSMLIETTLLNLGALSHHVGLSSTLSLPNSRVKFVRRQANGVAYVLEGDATLLSSYVVYFCCFLDFQTVIFWFSKFYFKREYLPKLLLG